MRSMEKIWKNHIQFCESERRLFLFCKVSKGMVNDMISLKCDFGAGWTPILNDHGWVNVLEISSIVDDGYGEVGCAPVQASKFLEERHIRLAYHGQNPQLAGNCGASPPLQFRLAYDCRDNHIQCFDVLLKNNSNPTNTRFLTKKCAKLRFFK